MQKVNKPPFVTFRLADSLSRELLYDWLRVRDTFLAVNPPPWDDMTEACYHGQFSDKLDEHLDAAHCSCALLVPGPPKLNQPDTEPCSCLACR